ncbi:MAG: energy transducer TonB [Pseudomonadota bacterium]
MKIPLLMALAGFAISSAAYAQAPSPALPAIEPAPLQADEVTVSPESAIYPPELVQAGVQGNTTITALLKPDGTTEQVSVKETSRSAKLDEIAVTIVKRLRYKARESASATPLTILVPVEFRKDTLAGLLQKTCADLNTDLAYFTATFPERRPSELKFFKLATGALYLAQVPADKIGFAKGLQGRYANTITGCAAQPGQKVFDVFRQASEPAPGK